MTKKGSSTVKVYEATSIEQIEKHIPPWEELILHQLDDDIFTTPQFLVPLVRYYPMEPYKFVFIYHESANRENIMIGAAAFNVVRRSKKIPVPHLSTLKHGHIASFHPSIHKDYAELAVKGLLDWLKSSGNGHVILWSEIYEDSNFFRMLKRQFQKNGRPFLQKGVQRAVMNKAEVQNEYIREQISSKKLKNLRRKKRQLERLGDLEFITRNDLNSFPDLLEDFFKLEAAGWKAKTGTALSCHSHERDFFSSMVNNFAKKKGIVFILLKLNGVPISIQSNFVQGKTLFAYKVGYDPSFKQYSPGILLELELMKVFQTHPRLVLADSCSVPNSYIESYWKERKTLLTLVFPTSRVGKFLVSAVNSCLKIKDGAEKFFRKARKVKSAFDRDIRYFGTTRALLTLVNKMAYKVVPFHIEYFYLVQLDRWVKKSLPQLPRDTNIRWANREDMGFISRMSNWDPDPNLPAKRFDQGHRCMILHNKNTILCFFWVTREINFFCPYLTMSEKSVYGFDLYTDPSNRGKRLPLVLKSYLYRELYLEGFENIVSAINWCNWASKRQEGRMGSQFYGWVLTFEKDLLSPNARRLYSHNLKNSSVIGITK